MRLIIDVHKTMHYAVYLKINREFALLLFENNIYLQIDIINITLMRICIIFLVKSSKFNWYQKRIH